MQARFVVPSVIVTTFAGLFAAPAWAGGEPLVDRYTESVYRVDTTAEDSTPRTLVDEQIVDRHGHVLSTASSTLDHAAEKAGWFRAAQGGPPLRLQPRGPPGRVHPAPGQGGLSRRAEAQRLRAVPVLPLLHG